MQGADVKKSVDLKEDRYDGVTVEGITEHTLSEFEAALSELLQSLQGKKLLWIKLPIERSDIIPLLTENGFVFHHCNETDITLLKKLTQNPVVPTAKNHTLGVGVVVLLGNDILVVRDRIHQTFKLPGGFIDDGENISGAVVREVLEETGVHVAFEAVVSLGHFTPAQFGESNLYVIASARPLSREIAIRDKEEILEARWMDVDAYLARDDVLPYNKALVRNALSGSKGLQIDNTVELRIKTDTRYELFF